MRPPQPTDGHTRDRDGAQCFPFLLKHFRAVTIAPLGRMRKLRQRRRRHLATETQRVETEKRLRCCCWDAPSRAQSRAPHYFPFPREHSWAAGVRCCGVTGQTCRSQFCVEPKS